tara:strand:- start:510 stop:902 length:393 start_codon:yes stop_codon:yes gene_type:complete
MSTFSTTKLDARAPNLADHLPANAFEADQKTRQVLVRTNRAKSRCRPGPGRSLWLRLPCGLVLQVKGRRDPAPWHDPRKFARKPVDVYVHLKQPDEEDRIETGFRWHPHCVREGQHLARVVREYYGRLLG